MSLPVLSRPVADPPTGALPPIPMNKPPRKSLGQTPSRLKLPSRPSALQTSQPVQSAPNLSPERASGASVTRGVRKVVSIGSFPQPPTVNSRPPTSASMASSTSIKKRTSDGGHSIQAPSGRSKKSPRNSTAPSFRTSQTPSLLNSAGDGMTVSARYNKRTSDAQSSVHSPPQSRSSSANGSYSTSATTFEEGDEDSRGRTKELEDGSADPKTLSKGKEVKGNVIVSVRVRPDVGNQNNTQTEGEWMVDGRRGLVAFRGKEGGDYHLDNVFTTHDDNAKVYDSAAKRLVRRVMEGYHGTVFAYGMTGTGKTFSMQGTMSSPGVIPLAITDIFSYIRETPHREFLLRVSYLEIYNEKIHDLLALPAGGVVGQQQEEIKLREDSKRGVYASPLKEEIVQSPTQLLRVIHRGDQARRTGSTQFNSRSSRSHAVVQIVVESRERIPGSGSLQENGKRVAMLPGGVRVSTLSLIDLAGSERAAEDKERRAEGAHINKSLLTLGTVIAKLSGTRDKNGNLLDKDGKHLPYRDSKLTRLLQPALSGNSLVSILCTIQIGAGLASAGSNHIGETLNTLKFAARAKNNIVSHAKKAVEELGSVNSGLLERYRSEIASLRAQLEGQQKSAAEKEERQLEREAEQRHEEQMLEMQLARTALKERIEHLNRLILCSKSTGVNSGTVSAMGMHSRLSNGTEFGAPRSVRSSASQSTLGVGPSLGRHPSVASLSGAASASAHLSFQGIPDEDEEAGGDFGDGRASLQAQVRALQADLQDKTRYISTLEKRLLQARRSSHSRVSMAFNKPTGDDTEMQRRLEEKDAMISDLQKTVSALRSAVRKREIAELTPEMSSSEFKQNRAQGHQSNSSNGSSHTGSQLSGPTHQILPGGPRSPLTASPLTILSPQKAMDKKRKTVDEMSRMLDEMIQDKVASGKLNNRRSSSVRVASRGSSAPRRHSRRMSVAANSPTTGPGLGTMVASLRERDSVVEPSSPS
ncbi:centromeric protein E [Cladophialophora yegresii CBS 114405]|uniref:Kinesin-like protein n=1 Tax=Cladophialophora yegresii CBS 114405 TaxID=1182544 RepID=W9X3R7_9EURO|nr:centromeric protein E [Cladophialophora yegresii CBS 114405]EXJ65134.1 centromeric protein E [Cladophialophora yegresii CBS 114405]